MPIWNMDQKCTFFRMAHNANLKHVSGWHIFQNGMQRNICAYLTLLSEYQFYLRGDYTTRFGTSILYYNFLMNTLKFMKVYIIRKGISQGRQSWYYFFTKNQHFWENHKKHIFWAFFFQNRLEKIWNSKNCFGIVLLTYNIHLDVAFSHFCEFLPIFWVSCQIRQKFHFFTKFSNFWPYLAWNFKNRQKLAKMRKRNI